MTPYVDICYPDRWRQLMRGRMAAHPSTLTQNRRKSASTARTITVARPSGLSSGITLAEAREAMQRGPSWQETLDRAKEALRRGREAAES